MNQQSGEPVSYHYLSVNRGRYFCAEHGAFCDSSDNYLPKCPLCTDIDGHKHWEINNVDRLLQVVGGLQNRSKRNVALLASLIGGIGLLRVVALVGNNDSGLAIHTLAELLIYIAVVALLFSFAMYGASMVHIRTTDRKALKTKTLKEWEGHLAAELSCMEWQHIFAGRLLAVSAVILALAVFPKWL